MMKEIWKFLHKPRYVDPGQLDSGGRTAARVAASGGHTEIVELLQVRGYSSKREDHSKIILRVLGTRLNIYTEK